MDLNDIKLTPKRKKICDSLGFKDTEDVLSYYPFRYEMYERTKYEDFKVGEQVCIVCELVSSPSTFRRGRLSTSRFKVLYEEEILNITIFNRPWIRNVSSNELITIIGKYDGNNKITASNYYVGDVSGTIIPYYPLKEGISQNDIKKLIQYVMNNSEIINDDMPSDIVFDHHLIDHKSAILNIHSPSTKKDLALAISRLKYEEFLKFYLALDILKGNTSKVVKNKKEFDQNKIDELINSFPFSFTVDQNNAINDILNDLRLESLMYRLVQGEVGSGKTAVAIIGLYANYLAGYQGVLMAPTEILAKQHYESLNNILSKFGVKVAVLYSSMDNERKVKEDIRNKNVDIIVGTHALFSQDVEYKDLGLVIADEQHRFGVKQRQALKDKGENVDFILMSATPIPRTLASSIYGDMDVSTIASLPAGRKGCKTYFINKNSVVDILDDIKAKLNEGRQIYIIAAAIEKSDNYNAKDINGLYESLKDVLQPYNVSLMHGKLSTEDKDNIMHDFSNNKIQVLISTTVVEVGVNVPNATMMIIYDADKFGLSQIHQLRGRVQRSSYEGTCYLLSANTSEEVKQRMNILCKTNDGFEIAYEDLKLRGPGDILGTRQSGLPTFILGNLLEDTKFIDAARNDAHKIVDNLDNDEYKRYYDHIFEIASKNFIS